MSSRTFFITRSASGQGATQCSESSGQQEFRTCAEDPCGSFEHYAEDWAVCSDDCGQRATEQERPLLCRAQPAGNVVPMQECRDAGVQRDESAIPLRRTCAATAACPDKDVNSARATIRLGGNVEDIPGGSLARCAVVLQRTFYTAMR
eukprot:SAG11_NODE_808_length_7088_cov_5.136357_5_plen_148_part_00